VVHVPGLRDDLAGHARRQPLRRQRERLIERRRVAVLVDAEHIEAQLAGPPRRHRHAVDRRVFAPRADAAGHRQALRRVAAVVVGQEVQPAGDERRLGAAAVRDLHGHLAVDAVPVLHHPQLQPRRPGHRVELIIRDGDAAAARRAKPEPGATYAWRTSGVGTRERPHLLQHPTPPAATGFMRPRSHPGL
jgi:hypothetical protein